MPPQETQPGRSRRPLALTVVAWIFILNGIYAILLTAYHYMEGSIDINPVILCISAGDGILRGNRAWRVFALLSAWFALLAAGFMAAVIVVKPHAVTITGLTFLAPWIGAKMFLEVASIALIVAGAWVLRVLYRVDTRDFFDHANEPNHSTEPAERSLGGSS